MEDPRHTPRPLLVHCPGTGRPPPPPPPPPVPAPSDALFAEAVVGLAAVWVCTKTESVFVVSGAVESAEGQAWLVTGSAENSAGKIICCTLALGLLCLMSDPGTR